MAIELAFPEPPLTDGGVLLRPWRRADLPAICAACQDPAISRWSPAIPRPYREQDARDWLDGLESVHRDGRALDLAVADAACDTRLLGAAGLGDIRLRHGTAAVGYWLAPEARGHGYITRAVRLLARWGFEQLGLARLELLTTPDNLASQRVAGRCGFRREGHLRSHMVIRHNGERRDSLVYGLLPDELM